MTNLNESWLLNNDTSNISMNIKKHIKHGRHRTKAYFTDSTDVVDPNILEYAGIDHIKPLQKYIEEMNLEKIEFSVFRCQSKSKIPAYYANIKQGNTSLASSFPEKYSLPEVAEQIAARNALSILKKAHRFKNIPITENMEVVAERLEKELQKNYAGLFCDKVEDIYKEVYSECLPSDWLACLNKFTSNITIEDLPKQNKSILYYTTPEEKKKLEELFDNTVTDTNLPLMKFVDKTERSVTVTCVDSNNTFWIMFVHDSINDDFDTLFKLMNTPDEYQHFSKMFNIEIFDIYAVQIDGEWYRYQVNKIEDDTVTGVCIDLGMEWYVAKSSVMFLPQKFMSTPSQAIKCSLSSLFFAPYFQVANEAFQKLLFGNEFTAVPDDIESEIPMITLYSGKCNVNKMVLKAIIQNTNFDQIDGMCKAIQLAFVSEGYVYLHPPNDTLLIMESILDSISISRPLDQLYSKKSISPHKLYLVKCTELGMWSRAVIDDFIFPDQKFKVYFVDYGNYGLIDQDKFIDLQSVDVLLASISPQALKVEFNIFPPEKLTDKLCRALHEMINEKSLDVKVVSTNNNDIQVVDIFDADDPAEDRVSFNIQLYQSV